jgi:DNA-binding SARP family transcriptional activator
MIGSAAPRTAQTRSFPQPFPSATAGPERDAEILTLPTRTFAATPPAYDEPRPTIELNVLGGFRLLIDGEPVHVGSTGQRLLAVVACRGRQATRSQIAHALWPDTTSARAHANLRTALYRLYRRAPGTIHATATHVQLTVGMQIDLEQATRLAKRILGHDLGHDRSLLNDALHANLYDDLLPEWDDEWLGDQQHRYRQLRLNALETFSTLLAAAGHHGAAVQTALAAVQADSLRDSAHEALIRAHLAQGNRNEALTHYFTYRRILRDELGLEPPAEIGRLVTSA